MTKHQPRYDLASPMSRIRFIDADGRVTKLSYVVHRDPYLRHWENLAANKRLIEGMSR
jgi:hypothetical protein